MFHRWRAAAKSYLFNRQLTGVFDLPPLELVDAPLSVVSMVSLPDLPRYLLALRRLYQELGRGKVVAIVGRDYPQKLRTLLRRHVPGIEIVETEAIDTGSCQRGGAWERLIYILDRSRSEYVIQMDSDTLIVGDSVPEVVQCVAEARPFTLGAGPRASGQAIVPMPQAQASLDFESSYVGITLQARLAEYPDAARHRYVRASAAFAGFAPGAFSRQQIEAFHRNIVALLGPRATEWGTEQCASNFAIANSPGAVVLPYPDYMNLENGDENWRRARFLHFRGAIRYKDGIYARAAGQVLALLRADATGRKA